ncbi:hypothetical protein CC1G_14094 [Coprinopsis cinerea okayama7|uniref:Uncharacterized protein n=1 Tax=Coprinopsis cinerea (strain Okayama-7 / 130 / ATCC MYA-4618 / FGSC 9003) TaxID=240176 RepID=D6RLH6_COPC7|nr:hypothetical protein CC1G_14094 [Coprinopsis cinerea okayama7\|eukprot:XP_002911562.1 hypothetical protein CC1G_14094 [Coprinopsis cinerea okayama7\
MLQLLTCDGDGDEAFSSKACFAVLVLVDHAPYISLSPSFQARTAEELSELVENPRLNPIIVIGRLTMSGFNWTFGDRDSLPCDWVLRPTSTPTANFYSYDQLLIRPPPTTAFSDCLLASTTSFYDQLAYTTAFSD